MTFDKLYNQHYEQIYRYCYRFVNNRETAGDIAQETFLKLYQRMSNIGYSIENTNAWLYKVAGNLCLNSIKSNNRQGTKIDIKSTDCIEVINPEENLIARERTERIRLAIEQISPKHRMLIFMYQDGLSYKEMSNATGIPFTSIGKTLWRCIDKISATLKNSENE